MVGTCIGPAGIGGSEGASDARGGTVGLGSGNSALTGVAVGLGIGIPAGWGGSGAWIRGPFPHPTRTTATIINKKVIDNDK